MRIQRSGPEAVGNGRDNGNGLGFRGWVLLSA